MEIKLQAFNNSIQVEWNNKDNIATFHYKEQEYGERIINIAIFLCSCSDNDIYETNECFTQMSISLNKLLKILTKLN